MVDTAQAARLVRRRGALPRVTWIIFFQAYELLNQSLSFAALAGLLAAALAAFLTRARATISSNMQRPSVGVS